LFTFPAFIRRKQSSTDRIYSQHWQQVCRNDLRGNLFRRTFPREVTSKIEEHTHVIKDIVLLFPIREVTQVDNILIATFTPFPNSHELLRIFVWQSTKYDCVDYCKDCRVRANTERKREDGDEGECRILQKHPDAETKIRK
jgi:hypothetical protein